MNGEKCEAKREIQKCSYGVIVANTCLEAICAGRYAEDWAYTCEFSQKPWEPAIIILLTGKMRLQEIKELDKCSVVYKS